MQNCTPSMCDFTFHSTSNAYIAACAYVHSNKIIRLVQEKMQNGMELKQIRYLGNAAVFHCMLLSNEY